MRTALRFLPVIVFGAAVSAPADAQWLNHPSTGVPRLPDGKANLAAPPPRTADGKPDLSGLWEVGKGGPFEPTAGGVQLAPDGRNIGAQLKGGLPYQPWAADLRNARGAENLKNAPDAHCLPLSILQMHTSPFPRKVLQVPGLVAILYEKNMEYRQIFTDERPLPKDPQPSWKGYSSGKWEGDTLVVQTIGFRGDLWADYGGSPLTEAARVTEKFRRVNYGNLEIEVSVDDPKAYTAPWTVTIKQYIMLDTELLEYSCLENQRFHQLTGGK